MTNHFARGSRGFSTSAATSGAAASGAGAGSGSGSSGTSSLIFCSTMVSSVMTPSWRGLAAQHLREEPGKQRTPRAQVRRQDRQDGHDDDGGRHQLSPARPVHPLEFGPDLAGIAHQPVPERGAFGPRGRGTGGDPRGLLIDAGFRETGHGASHKKKDFTATAHYRGGILACQSDDLWIDIAVEMDRDEDRCPFSNSNVQSRSLRDVAVIEPRLNDRIASCLKVHLDSLCDIQDYNILPQSCWSGRPLPVAGVSSGSLSDLRRACGIGRFRAEMKKALRGEGLGHLEVYADQDRWDPAGSCLAARCRMRSLVATRRPCQMRRCSFHVSRPAVSSRSLSDPDIATSRSRYILQVSQLSYALPIPMPLLSMSSSPLQVPDLRDEPPDEIEDVNPAGWMSTAV